MMRSADWLAGYAAAYDEARAAAYTEAKLDLDDREPDRVLRAVYVWCAMAAAAEAGDDTWRTRERTGGATHQPTWAGETDPNLIPWPRRA